MNASDNRRYCSLVCCKLVGVSPVYTGKSKCAAPTCLKKSKSAVRDTNGRRYCTKGCLTKCGARISLIGATVCARKLCGNLAQGHSRASDGRRFCSQGCIKMDSEKLVITVRGSYQCAGNQNGRRCLHRSQFTHRGANGLFYCSRECLEKASVSRSLNGKVMCFSYCCPGQGQSRSSPKETDLNGNQYCSASCNPQRARDACNSISFFSILGPLDVKARNPQERALIVTDIINSSKVQTLLREYPRGSIYIGSTNIDVSKLSRMSFVELQAHLYDREGICFRKGGRSGSTKNRLRKANGDCIGTATAAKGPRGAFNVPVHISLNPSHGVERMLQSAHRAASPISAILNGGNDPSGNLATVRGCAGVLSLTVLPDRTDWTLFDEYDRRVPWCGANLEPLGFALPPTPGHGASGLRQSALEHWIKPGIDPCNMFDLWKSEFNRLTMEAKEAEEMQSSKVSESVQVRMIAGGSSDAQASSTSS